MFCPICGTPTKADDIVCGNCGFRLKERNGEAKTEFSNAFDDEKTVAFNSAIADIDKTAAAPGFGGAEADYLGNISRQTGGQLMYAQNPEDLQEMYRLINGFISNDYTFNFKTSADSDALERTVKIVMPDGYYDEFDYVVGLTKEEIDVIINAAPKSDYYRQIGGSNKNGGIN